MKRMQYNIVYIYIKNDEKCRCTTAGRKMYLREVWCMVKVTMGKLQNPNLNQTRSITTHWY